VDWDLITVIYASLNMLTLVMAFIAGEKLLGRYSKFVSTKKDGAEMIDGRKGMLLFYSPALISHVVLYFLFGAPTSMYHILIFLGITIHFTKRLLEVLYVHIYTNQVDLQATLAGSVFYAASYGVAFAYYAHYLIDASFPVIVNFEKYWLIGAVLYVIGLASNGYHHWLLREVRLKKQAEPAAQNNTKSTIKPNSAKKEANSPTVEIKSGSVKVRVDVSKTNTNNSNNTNTAQSNTPPKKDSSDDQYEIPRGGLFEYVVCPHYFSELIELIGLAIIFKHLVGYLIVLFSIISLAHRADNTLKWYSKNKSNFPKDKMRLIPFIW
jgi:hypothetical protein